MKLVVKKTHCPVCNILVKGTEQKLKEGIDVVCSICNTVLWKWNGLAWRRGGRSFQAIKKTRANRFK